MADDVQTANAPLTIDHRLAQRIQDELGQNVYLCYQCIKCSSGCPLAAYLDWQPNQIMRAAQLGQDEIVLHAQTPWLCAGCQTCSTRCPQGLDIPAIMEFLTREALARGIEPAVPAVARFNRAFLRQVRLWGRAYEPGMLVEITLRGRPVGRDLALGLRMLRKGKFRLLPGAARSLRPTPRASAGALAYYPGCSLHSTAAEFDMSTRAVCETLGLQLVEPRGWVCCGSTAAHRAEPETAQRLPLHNLALIERSGYEEVVMPCAACFNRHQAALADMRRNAGHKPAVDAAQGYTYQDRVQVSTLSQALLAHVGLESIAAAVKRPLAGLRLVCYYGCLLTRPPAATGALHAENPTDLDRLLAAVGAEVRDWSYKTVCCGASHALTRPDIVLNLSNALLTHAVEAGADAVAVACPLCHANLDARQAEMGREAAVPVLYFTQLLALALGLPRQAAALHKNLVDPRPLLAQKGLWDETGD